MTQLPGPGPMTHISAADQLDEFIGLVDAGHIEATDLERGWLLGAAAALRVSQNQRIETAGG